MKATSASRYAAASSPIESRRKTSAGPGGGGPERVREESPDQAVPPHRPRAQLRVHEDDRDAAPPRLAERGGPELRLDEDEDARAGGAEEPPDGEGEVERERPQRHAVGFAEAA